MRLGRLIFILLAFYFALFGGSPYYYQLFPVRVLHHVVATAVLLLWLLNRLRNGRGLPRTPLDAPALALVIVWLLTALASVNPRAAFENLWFPITHLLLFYIAADLIQRGRGRWLAEAQFLLAAVVVIMAGVNFASWYFGLGLLPGTSIGWASVIGPDAPLPLASPMLYLPLGVSTWLAAYVAPLVVVTAAWGYTQRQRDHRLALYGLSIGLLLVLAGTTSRGGFIALGAAAAALCGLRVLGALLRNRSDLRRLLPLFAAGASIAAVAIVAIALIGQGAGRIAGDRLRLDLWRGAAEMTADHLLTGVGPGLFGRVFREYRDPAYVDDRLGTAHNAYLNTMAETGLLGVAVMLLAGAAIARAWWRLWRGAEEQTRRLQLEAALAALIGLGAQSLFDTFVSAPIVMLSIFLIATCTIAPGSALAPQPTSSRGWAAALAAVLAIYALALFQFDRAQAHHLASLRAPDLETALFEARAAAALDPALGLYDLQIAYLTAAAAAARGDHEAALAAYQTALEREPTWEAGWLNLAGHAERAGAIDVALAALERAIALNHANGAAIHWARLAEAYAAAPADTLLERYRLGMARAGILDSAFWSATPLRQTALAAYVNDEAIPLIARWQAAAAHGLPLDSLIAGPPATAADWWVRGERALAIDGSPAEAFEAFSAAIRLSRSDGDLYAARARARLPLGDLDGAARDLDLAELLGTRYERPGVVRVALAEHRGAPLPEIARLRAEALPPRVINQNFEGVLYQGRVASFDVLPSMRPPGPGRAALGPWYDLAAARQAAGDTAGAEIVLRAIADYAPGEPLTID